eukprot:261725-Lingulodinium_polyedra.AAC.1
MMSMKRSLCQKLGVDPATFIPLGSHGVVSLNFLAFPSAERVLCCVADKRFCSKGTLEAMLEV